MTCVQRIITAAVHTRDCPVGRCSPGESRSDGATSRILQSHRLTTWGLVDVADVADGLAWVSLVARLARAARTHDSCIMVGSLEGGHDTSGEKLDQCKRGKCST